MIIELLSEQYRCGSNIGMYFADSDTFLSDLNEVVELDQCIYPSKWVEAEDKEDTFRSQRMTMDEFFDTREKKLVPGMKFIYDGQVFAIDSEKRLILLVSETGILSARRFINDILKEELRLVREYGKASNVKIEEINEIPEDLSKISVPYYRGNIWKNRVNLPEKFKVTFDSPESFSPIELWIDRLIPKIYYDPDIVFEDQVEDLSIEFFSWSYKEMKKELDIKI